MWTAARSSISSAARSSISSAATLASPALPGGTCGGGDDLAVGVDGDMSSVSVEAAVDGLVPVAVLGVNGGDGPGRRRWPTAPRLGHRPAELAAIEQRQAAERVAGTRSRPAHHGRRDVPVDLWLGRAGVVVTAVEHTTQLSLECVVGDAQQIPQSRAEQRDRVHRRHRVIQRRRVQHPPCAHQPRSRGGIDAGGEDAPRIVGRGQAGPHVEQTSCGRATPRPRSHIRPPRSCSANGHRK